MKSTQNIVQSPPKDHKFPHVRSHYYQSPLMGNQQFQIGYAYPTGNHSSNRSNLQSSNQLQKSQDQGSEKPKQSGSSNKYTGSNHFKSSYFQFASSQRKFNQKGKQGAVNLSHNIERSNNSIAKKKLAGIIDNSLPPLSMGNSSSQKDPKAGISSILMPRPSQPIHKKQPGNKKSPNRENNSFQLDLTRQSQQQLQPTLFQTESKRTGR